MADDVEYTENDYRIALQGLVLQAKVHGTIEPTGDGRFIMSTGMRNYMLHLAGVSAAHYAMERFVQRALHSRHFNIEGD